MAVLEGTVVNTTMVRGDALTPLQFIAIYFTVSGTYSQTDEATLLAVSTIIKDSRRTGKTVALKTASLWQPARKSTNPALFMTLSKIVISSADITFQINETATESLIDVSTEAAAAALAEQSAPFALLVGFQESDA